MSDEHEGRSASAKPTATRAVILVCPPRRRAVEQALVDCREYAAARGFTIVDEIIAPIDDRALLRGVARQVEGLFRRRRADAIIFGPRPADPGVLLRVIEPLLRLDVHFHSVESGPMTEDDLFYWLLDDQRLPPDAGLPTVRRSSRRSSRPRFSATPPPATPRPRPAAEDSPDARSIGIAHDAMLSGNIAAGRDVVFTGPPGIGSGPPPGVPLQARQGPLPHDGLFIRRNNAFGTKSTLGIRDLIDQGVLIEQTRIRFDDFVDVGTDQIPAPDPGEAIAVSNGAAEISGDHKAHAATTHFLEIALKAASEPSTDGPSVDPLPVNLVFVIDTSLSMRGEKLDTVKTAVHELYRQLRDTDVLGIVTFDTDVRTALRATPKGQLSEDEITSVVAGLHADGATDINLGVLYGIDEISRHAYGHAGYVSCIYLFSDGDPTSGETNWIRIRTNIAARVRGDLTLSCFGFGSDARMRELDALAGLTGGHSTFVTDPDDLRLNLEQDLSRREHLAAINIQLQIKIDPDVTIWHLYGHDLITDPATRAAVAEEARAARRLAHDEYGVESLPDLIGQNEGIRIFAPDLAFDETYWIVLELQAPPGPGRTSFGSAMVQYVDTLAAANRRHEIALSGEGTIPAETVLVHAIGLWTSEITFYALDDLYQNDRETAKARLSNHIQVLQAIDSAIPSAPFRNDQVTFRKLISLAENLGLPRSWSEDVRGGALGYAVYAMSEFGRVRGGFVKTRLGTM